MNAVNPMIAGSRGGTSSTRDNTNGLLRKTEAGLVAPDTCGNSSKKIDGAFALRRLFTDVYPEGERAR